MLVQTLPADSKTPGQRYCFLGVCHRVKSLAETRALVGKTEIVHASFYYEAGRDRFNPSNITSSGEYFRASRPDNAASPILPNGTKLLVWHPVSKRAVVVRINNAGPYWGRRTLDLSRGAAERLGMLGSGVASVMTRVLEAPTPAEATYRRNRTYAPVPGYLGAFASLEQAYVGARRALGSPPPPLGGGPQPRLVAPDDLAPPPELGPYLVAAVTAPTTTLVETASSVAVAAAETLAADATHAETLSRPLVTAAAGGARAEESPGSTGRAAKSARGAKTAKAPPSSRAEQGGRVAIAAAQPTRSGGAGRQVRQQPSRAGAVPAPVAAAPRRAVVASAAAPESQPVAAADTQWLQRITGVTQ